MARNITPTEGLDVGDRLTVTTPFAGAVEEDVVIALVRAPGNRYGAEVDAGDIDVGSGVVTYGVDITSAGIWRGRTEWTGTEDAKGADEWFAVVRDQRVTAQPATT